MVFSRLDYPDKFVNSTITRFIADKASDQPTSRLPAATNGQDPVGLVLPFKDQASADIVRKQLNDLCHKIHKTIQPVFASQKIKQHLKLREAKPPLVNQQSLVYQFKCDLCDAGYVGFTRRHLHKRVDEHRHTSSSIGKHFVTNTLRHRKISQRILPSSKNATASLTASSMRCFLLTN